MILSHSNYSFYNILSKQSDEKNDLKNDNPHKKNIKTLILLFALLTGSCGLAQVEKITVDRGCQPYVSRKQNVNELYTKPTEVVSNFMYKVNVVFSLKNLEHIIYFALDSRTFGAFKSDNIYLTLDSNEIIFSNLVDYEKKTVITGLLETEYIYYVGYKLTDDLRNEIAVAENMSFGLINQISKKKKIWNIKSYHVRDIKESLDCFGTYSLPIITTYEESLIEYPTDFRKHNWKDSKEQALEKEAAELFVEDEERLIYLVELNNDNYHAYLFFHDNELHQGVYAFMDEFVNENSYYSKFKEVSKLLTSKYGEMRSKKKYGDKGVWDEPGEIGMAIQTGHYSEVRIWETKNTIVKLKIGGENFDSKLTIRYFTKDKSLEEKVKKKLEEKSLDGF